MRPTGPLSTMLFLRPPPASRLGLAAALLLAIVGWGGGPLAAQDPPPRERWRPRGSLEPGRTIDQLDPEFWRLTQERLRSLAADAFRRRGRELLARVDPASAEQAILLLQKATHFFPEDAGLLGDYAEALLAPYRWTWNREEKWRREAREAVDRALALDPERPEAIRSDGLLLMLEARLEEAEAALRRALDRAPEDADTLLLLGAVLRLQRRYPDAYRILDRAIAAAPSDWRAYSGMADVYRDDQWYEEALNLYRKAEDLDAGAFAPRFGEAAVYQRYGHAGIAIRLQNDLLKEHPKFKNLILLSAATNHMQVRRWQSAIEELEQISFGGDRGLCDGSVLYRLGLCRLELKDEARAEAAFRRAIDEFPLARDGSDYGPRVLFPSATRLAALFEGRDRPREALEVLERVSQDPEAPLSLQIDLAARLAAYRLHDRAADALRRGLESERPADRLDERVRLRVDLVRQLVAADRRTALAEQARPALLAMEERVEQEGSPVDCLAMARGRALLGDPEPALRWLSRAVERGYDEVAALRTDPDLESLRSRPGFDALLRGR